MSSAAFDPDKFGCMTYLNRVRLCLSLYPNSNNWRRLMWSAAFDPVVRLIVFESAEALIESHWRNSITIWGRLMWTTFYQGLIKKAFRAWKLESHLAGGVRLMAHYFLIWKVSRFKLRQKKKIQTYKQNNLAHTFFFRMSKFVTELINVAPSVI